MRNAHEIIKRLLRTEKAMALNEKENKYCFEVDKASNKIEVRKAVEDLYKVQVTSVNTQVIPGKPKTVRFDLGYKKDWKKAVVTLGEGQKIDLTT